MRLWSHAANDSGPLQCSLAILLCVCSPHILFAQISADSGDVGRSSSVESTEQRLMRLEQSHSQLIEQNRQLSSELKRLSAQTIPPVLPESNSNASLVPPSPSTDLAAPEKDDSPLFNAYGRPPENIFPSSAIDTAAEFPLERRLPGSYSKKSGPPYYVGFDRGFVVRPLDKEESPFELKINGQSQVRYTDFARNISSWTDSAGNVFPVSDVNSFQIPRGRMIYSGILFKPELSYNLNIDYNTASNRQINFRAFWLAWRFNRAMTLYAGQSKVPGGREWLASFVNTLGPDRSMATTFFRPSLSQGIWMTGEPADGLFYHVMASNGFNTLGTASSQLNTLMSFSGSVWWEPWGDFGGGYSDFEWHAEPAVRLGASGTYSPEQGPQGSPNLPENSDLRFSDGTLITETGALAPGVTLNTYKIGLTTLDLAYKHRGFGASGEIYLQDLFDLSGDGALPNSSIVQYGGFVQAGYFVIPQKCEPYARFSAVKGPSGTGSEYAGGFNWFFLPGKQNLRFTLDTAWLNHNPADQNRTGYVAGQTGLLVRSQIQIFF